MPKGQRQQAGGNQFGQGGSDKKKGVRKGAITRRRKRKADRKQLEIKELLKKY